MIYLVYCAHKSYLITSVLYTIHTNDSQHIITNHHPFPMRNLSMFIAT